jgi:radical SAM enzyme (TIGR01210 family)
VTDTRQPAGVELCGANVRGRPADRLMVILRAPGCIYARHTGGCSNCGFAHLTTGGDAVAAEHLSEQLRRALHRHPDRDETILQLDLYCSGSFFCDEEIQPEARDLLLEQAAQLPAVEVVVVESRPEFINEQVLRRSIEALSGPRPIQLEVAIGLETANDHIRQERIKKGFSRRAFEDTARLLAEHGVALVAHVLLKPIGTDEAEALDDVLRTGRYLKSLAKRVSLPARIALEPTFVPEGTPLYEELLAGRYHPPSLWSVVHAASSLLRQGLPVHVGLSSEGLPAAQVPRGCDRCTAKILHALASFNATQDLELLAGLSCTCQGSDDV